MFYKEKKKKVSLSKKGDKNPSKRESVRSQISDTVKTLWQDDDYKEKQIYLIRKGLSDSPNKAEQKLHSILEKLFPGEYRFVGDGEVIIAGKNPDFININGQKKIIELFGDYWHSEEVVGRPAEEEEKQRIEIFQQYGYKTLIVWEKELKNKRDLKKKLLAYNSHP